MKRLLVVFAVLVVVMGFSLGRATAQTGNSQLGQVSGSAQQVTTQATDLECGAALFFGGVTLVGSYFTGGGLFAWLGIAGGGYSAEEIARNHTCAADSFYDHIGYRELCWQAHFINWNPISGHAMFDNRDGACNVSPITADGVLCNYLHGAPLDQCNKQLTFDFVTQVLHIISGGLGF